MVVNGRATVVPCLSGARHERVVSMSALIGKAEIGIFGVYVGDGEKVLMNEYGGYLMRTKVTPARWPDVVCRELGMQGAMNDEGGVASGYAVLDTPSLCD